MVRSSITRGGSLKTRQRPQTGGQSHNWTQLRQLIVTIHPFTLTIPHSQPIFANYHQTNTLFRLQTPCTPLIIPCAAVSLGRAARCQVGGKSFFGRSWGNYLPPRGWGVWGLSLVLNQELLLAVNRPASLYFIA